MAISANEDSRHRRQHHVTEQRTLFTNRGPCHCTQFTLRAHGGRCDGLRITTSHPESFAGGRDSRAPTDARTNACPRVRWCITMLTTPSSSSSSACAVAAFLAANAARGSQSVHRIQAPPCVCKHTYLRTSTGHPAAAAYVPPSPHNHTHTHRRRCCCLPERANETSPSPILPRRVSVRGVGVAEEDGDAEEVGGRIRESAFEM